jgi:hypothetical protein
MFRNFRLLSKVCVLSHAETRMTEMHYAHLAPSYVAETIRANFPRLELSSDVKVIPMRCDRSRIRNAS